MKHCLQSEVLTAVAGKLELAVRAVYAREVQAAVERMIQQPLRVRPVMEQLAEKVPPPEEERVSVPGCKKPTFHEI
eukprot:CAMPEP_0194557216 /NCGR_PEP_ID=MMETSP0253-20130528/99133_1 /TAXON_ID=2966 /ORGANISM="Noctiluca scintillans" /LENGTH=75 /DNA_ID=CAMNT_0039404719 /DNA_START=498 /DNA_END=725 /DNA_ORIENTATION=-